MMTSLRYLKCNMSNSSWSFLPTPRCPPLPICSLVHATIIFLIASPRHLGKSSQSPSSYPISLVLPTQFFRMSSLVLLASRTLVAISHHWKSCYNSSQSDLCSIYSLQILLEQFKYAKLLPVSDVWMVPHHNNLRSKLINIECKACYILVPVYPQASSPFIPQLILQL